MPVTLSAEEFSKKYGGASTASRGAVVTLSADEFAAKYGPGPARRFLQGVGVPTSIDELGAMAKQFSPLHNPEAAGGPALPIAHGIMKMLGGEMGDQAGQGIAAAQAGDYEGAMKHALGAAVPVVGPPMAEGNIAGAAGRAAGLLAPMGVAKAGEVLGPMLERAGAPPLKESIGSLITGETTIQKFTKVRGTVAAQNAQKAAIERGFPNTDVIDTGDQFVVRKIAKNTVMEPAPPEAPTTPAPGGLDGLMKHAGRTAVGTAMGSGAGFLLGGPGGAVVGGKIGAGMATAADAAMTMKSMMRSPLWKATSATLKTEVGRAMQAQDFSTVAAIGSRILSGAGLDDEFGHDSALHGLVNSITQHGTVQMSPPEIRQALDDYDAVYVNKDGTSVAVPYHVSRQMKDKLGGQ